MSHSPDSFTFEVRREKSAHVLQCKCGRRQEALHQTYLGASSHNTSASVKFTWDWVDEEKIYTCRKCERRVTPTQEVIPVMVEVSLSYIGNQIDYLIEAAVNNSSKRSSSAVGEAKQRRIRKDDIVPDYNEKIEINLRKIEDS
jgi:hypothetical protein